MVGAVRRSHPNKRPTREHHRGNHHLRPVAVRREGPPEWWAMNAAELSSLSTAIDELGQRISSFIDEADANKREDVAADLMEVERSLKTAGRRLRKLVETISRGR